MNSGENTLLRKILIAIIIILLAIAVYKSINAVKYENQRKQQIQQQDDKRGRASYEVQTQNSQEVQDAVEGTDGTEKSDSINFVDPTAPVRDNVNKKIKEIEDLRKEADSAQNERINN